MMIR
jgi:hypothetical protein